MLHPKYIPYEYVKLHIDSRIKFILPFVSQIYQLLTEHRTYQIIRRNNM